MLHLHTVLPVSDVVGGLVHMNAEKKQNSSLLHYYETWHYFLFVYW